MSRANFNRVTYLVVEDRAKKEGLPFEPFTVHDRRRYLAELLPWAWSAAA